MYSSPASSLTLDKTPKLKAFIDMTGAPTEQEKGDAIAAAVVEVVEENAATQDVADASDGGADQEEKEKKEWQSLAASSELEGSSNAMEGQVEEEEEEEEEEALASNATVTPLETPSFKEESYVVSELKEAERKALEAFRLKVEEAIRNKTILKKEKKEKEKEKKQKEKEKGGASVQSTAPAVQKEEKAVTAQEAAEESVPEKSAAAAAAEEGEGEEEAKEMAVKEASREAEEADVVVRDDEDEDEDEKAGGEGCDAIAAEAGADVAGSHSHETKFYLWGGIPVHEQEEEKTDVALLKFLRARNFKVEEALAMLKSTIRWRREFRADEIAEEEEEELAEEGFEALAYQQGLDRHGHPVCYNLNPFQCKQLSDDKAKLCRFLRWRVQLMEKSIASLDFSAGGINSIVHVIDLQNSPGFRKVSIQAIKKFLSLLHDNYPELAAKQIILNIPWWYVPAVYRSFHDKVVWAGPGKSTETLFKFIAPEHVPARYGGLYRSDDTEFQGVDAPVSEVTVKAGEKRELEFPVEEGVLLLWDVSVVGWDVVYGEEFVPETYTVIVRKPRKIAASAQVEPIRNTYKASEPGKLVITIDNSLSKKKKTVVYRTKSTTTA